MKPYLHVVKAWLMGNTALVAARHYLQVTATILDVLRGQSDKAARQVTKGSGFDRSTINGNDDFDDFGSESGANKAAQNPPH